MGRSLTEPNQGTYQRLKLSLSLNLRRQVFLAVCDDLTLRNRLAAKLYAEMAYPNPQRMLAHAYRGPDAGLLGLPSVEHSSAIEYPRFVSLTLDLTNPNLVMQVARWLKRYPPPRGIQRSPGFQILGTEQLTRQPAFVQQQFLIALQEMGRSPQGGSLATSLESPLLIWLTRPWFQAIQQSAPTFWDAHTALFEFEGDPTPVTARNRSTSNGKTASAAGFWNAQPPAARLIEPLKQPPPAHVADHRHDLLAEDLAFLDELRPEAPASPEPEPAPQPGVDLLPTEPVQESGAAPKPVFAEDRASAPIGELPVPAESPVQSTLLPVPAEPLPELPSLISRTYYNLAVQVQATVSQPLTDRDAEALQLARQIEQVQAQATPAELAAAYQTLGNLYRDRIEQGDTAEATLVVGILAYENLLLHLDNSVTALWADVLNDIGNLYWMLSRHPIGSDRAITYLEQGLAAYRLALMATDAAERPQTYAMIQNNLGSTYGDLARYENPAETLQKSIQAYEAALRYRSPNEDPARYAATQNNLGTAYWNLAQHQQPVACLQSAIVAYSEALQYYSQDSEPLHYAMIQNNLGTAYWNLAQYDPAVTGKRSGQQNEPSAHDLLTEAIAAYQTALTYRTLEVSPTAHAATQNNLGTAYWHLANLSATAASDRAGLLEQAITAYQTALTAVEYLRSTSAQAALTFDPLATQNNLGLAYYQLATDKQANLNASQCSNFLDLALQNHLKALEGWRSQPDFYQTALSYVVQTVRAFYTKFGMNGQNAALSKIPAGLLPELMKRI